jgi:hypothetical protein
MNFPKQATTISEEITLWKKRGLIICDEANTAWAPKFAVWLKQHPKVPIEKMGFPAGWNLI